MLDAPYLFRDVLMNDMAVCVTKAVLGSGVHNSYYSGNTNMPCSGHQEVHGDAEPEKGFFYRSDHFNFAKQGVPALDPDGGVDYIGKPPEYAKQVRDEWTEKRYHTPKDVVMPDWDLTGVNEDLRVLFAVGYRVAQADKMPEWKPGNEFKAKRDATLKK